MSTIKCLEFFFGEVPQFTALGSRYPHLTKLTIVGQATLTSLRGLETLPLLRELWVIECGLRNIAHLDHAERLEKLYLYSNRIEAIDGLSRCSALSTLWLDDNCIGAIANLSLLPALRELNLAQNRIYRLEAIDWGESVEWLNLSGNPLPLTDLPALAQLPRLTALHLQDPMYAPAPCTRLCNFRLFCVQLLPRLLVLDGVSITEHERYISRQHLASRLVYYRALRRHVAARCQEQVAHLRRDWHSFLTAMGTRLRQLNAKLVEVAAAGEADPGDGGEPPVSAETLAAFRGAIRRRMDGVTSVARGQAAHSSARLGMLVKRRQLVQSLLELEYRTVGNVRCEELHVGEGPAGSRVSALNRYLGREKIALSATKNVHLMAMYKVNNRFLENVMVQSSATDKQTRVLDRFLTTDRARDIDWILEACKGNIITQVTVSTNLDGDEAADGRPQSALRQYFGCFREALLVQVLALPQGKTVPTRVPTSLGPDSEELASRRIILAPKFILLYTLGEVYNNRPLTCLASSSLDDDLLNSVCLPTSRAERSPTVALRPGEPGGTSVSLSGRGIEAIDGSENVACLREVDLSFNELKSVAFLRNMLHLTTLDLSFNDIDSVTALPMMPSLASLNLSWNRLENLPKVLRRLSVASPVLRKLNITFNPWRVPEERQCQMVAVMLPGLQELQGQSLSYPESAVTTFRRLHCPMEIGDLSLPPPAPPAEGTGRLDPRKLTAICLDGQMLQNLKCIKDVPFLQRLSLNDNLLTSLRGLEAFPHLEYLSADFNELADFTGLPAPALKLRSLSVRHNTVTSLSSLAEVGLPLLELLDISGNPVSSLAGVERLTALTELYVTACRLKVLSALTPIATCRRLRALDASGNPVCAEPNYRRFAVYRCRPLQMLDGASVGDDERGEAVRALSGLLSQDRLMETLAPAQLRSVTQLDLPSCGVRQVELPTDCLQQVTSLSLENNELTVLSGLQRLPRLRVLNLTNNAVRRLRERAEPPLPAGSACFPALQVLILAGNGLVQLGPLQLSVMRALTTLFLHDNEIKALDGLSRCSSLQLLVADRNQLQSLPAETLASLASLRALHLESNRIRRLPSLWPPQLRALYLAHNKLSEPMELTRLSGRLELRRASLYKNPLTRNVKWQAILCASQPSLQLLDGSPVSDVFGGRPALDGLGDGDSADEEGSFGDLMGPRSVWWRPPQKTVWGFRPNEAR
ncbi:Leucine-rich repeat-containing protein 9 [Amphibalanus amphitrite]|uniref:Leucine-rich repeat-containing protein 9 n=1 Tax=Amphibalanus amphitrite TaxID=1232801 RepID=A0A6A4VBX3_AMPAM|nr:Leucine-rich repeat-containing protein 9 [Amphibalanus amphitrite]